MAPSVRASFTLDEKIRKFAELGFDAVQFHDDDAVPDMNDMTREEIIAEAGRVKGVLDANG